MRTRTVAMACTEDQHKAICRAAAARGIPVAELLRRALELGCGIYLPGRIVPGEQPRRRRRSGGNGTLPR